MYITEKITFYTLANRLIGLMGRVFANDPGDRGSIPGRVIPKSQKKKKKKKKNGTWCCLA